MKNIINETLETIKREHIAPKSRWAYLAGRYGWWAMIGVAFVLAGIVLALTSDDIFGLDWDIMHGSGFGRAVFVVSILPYAWLGIFAVVLGFASFGLRRTDTGYRYPWFSLVVIATVGSVLLGSGLLLSGFGPGFRAGIGREFPALERQMMTARTAQWMRPAEGLLAGTLETAELADSQRLQIRDLDGQIWTIQLTASTLVRPAVELSPGSMIKIIGTMQGSSQFTAQEIRPWMGRGMMNRGGSHGVGGR